MMNSVETSRSPNLRDFLCLRSKMSLMFLICYSSPLLSSMIFSQSPSRIEGRRNDRSVSAVPRGVCTGPADVDPCPPGTLRMCLEASRRNPNVLRLRNEDKDRQSQYRSGRETYFSPASQKG